MKHSSLIFVLSYLVVLGVMFSDMADTEERIENIKERIEDVDRRIEALDSPQRDCLRCLEKR